MRMDKKNNELSAFILLFIVTSHGKLQVRYIVDLPLMFVIWDTQLNSDMFLWAKIHLYSRIPRITLSLNTNGFKIPAKQICEEQSFFRSLIKPHLSRS